MARLDWKHGRFSETYEVNEIHGAIYGHVHNFGDFVDWYRFLREDSHSHDVYDEGEGVGRVYGPPIHMPVIHATHDEGRNEDLVEGFYFRDSLHLSASFSQLTRAGLTRMDLEAPTYLKDRIVYDTRVFRVTAISVLGQIRQRDIVVGIDCTQVKPDELVNDLQFAKWANLGPEG